MTEAPGTRTTETRASTMRSELGSELRISINRLSRRLRLERSNEDITFNQSSALGSLARCGDLTIGELAAIEKIKPPSMTRIVNSLVDAGLVERRPHETDRRQIMVSLTEHARIVLAESRRRRDQWLAARLADLDADEIDLLRRAAPLLDRLAQS